MNRYRMPLALMGSFFLAGCTAAWFTPTADIAPPRPDDCEIEVFSAGPPTAAYEELGILEGEGELWNASLADVLPDLKREACRAGGDAIVMQTSQRYGSGEDDDEKFYTTATVIRWIR
jgi:hypothetical protein